MNSVKEKSRKYHSTIAMKIKFSQSEKFLNENYKTCMKEVKKDAKTLEDNPCSPIGGINII